MCKYHTPHPNSDASQRIVKSGFLSAGFCISNPFLVDVKSFHHLNSSWLSWDKWQGASQFWWCRCNDFARPLCMYHRCSNASPIAGIIATIFPTRLAIHLHDRCWRGWFNICFSLIINFCNFCAGTEIDIFLVLKTKPRNSWAWLGMRTLFSQLMRRPSLVKCFIINCVTCVILSLVFSKTQMSSK